MQTNQKRRCRRTNHPEGNGVLKKLLKGSQRESKRKRKSDDTDDAKTPPKVSKKFKHGLEDHQDDCCRIYAYPWKLFCDRFPSSCETYAQWHRI